MRQEVTRAHKGWALDSVTLHNDVTKSFKEEIGAPPNVSTIMDIIKCTMTAVLMTLDIILVMKE